MNDLPEMEDELRELLADQIVQTSITSEITAEILKVEGEEGVNVIEFRKKDGSPQLYNDHIKWIIEHMQQSNDED